MNYTVVGIFDSKNEARQAMNELIQNGFVEENIDMSEGRYNDDSAQTSTAGQTTAAGSTSSSANEGIGDSVSNFFSNLFSDDNTRAQNYTNVARNSEAILTVQADSQERAQQVAEIFDRYGSVDVDERSTQYQQSSQTGGNLTGASNLTGTSDASINNRTNSSETATTGGSTIPVIEEELRVGKREVQHGGVRVRSHIVEKPVEEHLRLREERVIVNRHPVNRAVTDADMNNFKEGDFEITERGEEAVVSKQARVVEEIEIGKQVEERDEVVRDTVRRTDVDVQEIKDDVNRNANSTRTGS
ncbi:MAG: hypothetical protein JWN60_2947 [Acidobacteria bacterium]|jgi:uncharacterized protein (TIGR02271 family)|nr:hypothetical protein [Acidobacteriota bacterium]